jgi:hypothetical protein
LGIPEVVDVVGDDDAADDGEDGGDVVADPVEEEATVSFHGITVGLSS